MAIQTLERGLNWMMGHFVVVCLIFALPILTLLGVGDTLTVSMLGLLLCAVGFMQRSAKVDLWIFVPLVVYNLINMASAYAVYGTIFYGYAPTQLIFPVIYLLMACLDKKELCTLKQLCVLWAGAAAAFGIAQFSYFAVAQSAKRLSGLLSNPNAMGIFLVAGWFALLAITQKPDANERSRPSLLPHLEPLLLAALALTLSMGSFAAMAAGILVLAFEKKLQTSWRETFSYVCQLLARASLGIGSGILMYLAASRTDVPWICLIIVGYLLALMAYWKQFERFLTAYPWISAAIAAMGALVAAAAVAVRPSAYATFAERLAMMRNGLRYLLANPLLGVGPYQWRWLNMQDSDPYFNTWHIHNVLIHVGVECGLIAMAMLILTAFRAFRKKTGPKGELAAFCFHNMMDTSYFYMGIMGLTMLTVGDPQCGGKKAGGGLLKLLFGCFAAVFLYDLCTYLRTP